MESNQRMQQMDKRKIDQHGDQKELSDFTKLEKSSINRNLKRLIDAELISSVNFPKLQITPKGKIVVNQIIPEWKKAMSEIEALLGQDGKEALNTLMDKLIK